MELKDMSLGMKVQLTRDINDHILGRFGKGERGTIVATRDAKYNCGTHRPICVAAIVQLNLPHKELEKWNNCLWLDSKHCDLTSADFEPFHNKYEVMAKTIEKELADGAVTMDTLLTACVLHMVQEDDWSEQTRFELLMEGSLPYKNIELSKLCLEVALRFGEDEDWDAKRVIQEALDYHTAITNLKIF